MNKFCRFDLGMLDEEIAQIADHFSVHNPIDVYKENGRMYAEFDACSESEIDAHLEEACQMILTYYPQLSMLGAAFEA